MNKVYVTQQQPYKDVSPALAYGEIINLVPSGLDILRDTEEIRDCLYKNLVSITKDDYLLLIGSPILIGMACIVAQGYLTYRGHTQSNLTMLQWDRRGCIYIPVKINI